MKINTLFRRGDEIIRYISPQDGPKGHLFGFFSHDAGSKGDLPTFFGMRLSRLKKNGWKQIA